MNVNEKTLARYLFQNKIFKSDGQSFEDMFIAIMNYAEEHFQAIKPWGNIGDRKNDGYIRNKGIFYQVYAPEDLDKKSYVSAVNKLKIDFAGLKAQWEPINEFYFVINDKYKGVNADCEKAIQEIKDEYGLINAGFLTAKDMEDILFSLDDDQILSITGFIPDPSNIKQIDYSILNEVIDHIMKLSLRNTNGYEIILPDWDKKIAFNKLSIPVANLLYNGYFQVYSLEEYLANNSDFLADALRDKLNEVYCEERDLHTGDKLFWAMVNRLSPREEQAYQTTVIIIMAKYFEACDIFEDPSQEEEKC
ncbi:MAG TPA: hypothetical protein GX723_11440 [Thermoanaerobacterales bacterium]|nr:hypothetical protein [Thermoanaerobacterales bacterium]